MKLHAFLYSVLTALIFSTQTLAFQVQSQVNIIPKPAKITYAQGQFTLHSGTPVVISEQSEHMQFLAKYVAEILYSATWYRHDIHTSTSPDSGIVLTLSKNFSIENEEAYILNVTKKKVVITSGSTSGLFYGIQSLRQLLPESIEYEKPSMAPRNQLWKIPAVTITDYPRFEYRGMHLDVARHFFPVEFVKKYIDLLAMYKMNRFHWHLTEDQGWRIEIKKYPKLTEIGAWRDSTLIGNYGSGVYDNVRHGGFYTQEEIKEVVEYAQRRHITIIPEIEMPGHSSAALAAYPEFGCFDKEYQVLSTWGVFEDIFCPKEETFDFLEDVLTEVMELFPSTYIHIGGDEAPKKQWEESEAAQEVIRREGLKDEHELQSYFIRRIEAFLNENGRQIIGWDEILEGGLAPQATVMSWRGEAGGIEAAKMQHDVIMTPNGTNYFDHFQAEPTEDEPISIGGMTKLEDVYAYDPVPEELTPDEAKYILGSQGNVWSEYLHSGKKVEYMAFPRAIALAEVVWSTKDGKDFNEFLSRLQSHFKRLDILDVNYGRHYRD
jgi:hexosaminidase